MLGNSSIRTKDQPQMTLLQKGLIHHGDVLSIVKDIAH